ncbi:MAG: exodeoxyribonuclease V subunit beta [Deltaproteobacteria bacterium]|nr:exodeoxyribonuclease V subunit beta [Deltaproteobacteria bacterium]
MTCISPFREYDLLDYPLDQGRVLIEAAAGSGKTYTIQYLFLRLILERVDLKVGNILVVTFTEAATEELKERIRAVLKAAVRRLDRVTPLCPLDPKSDGDLGRVLLQAQAQGASVAFLKERLKLALVSFDEVVIATIHGFCNRILSDYAFACGVRSGVELVKNSRQFIEAVAEDYWRRRFYRGSASLARIAADYGLQLDTLIKLAERLDQDPDLVVLPEKPEHGSWSEDILSVVAELEKLTPHFNDGCRKAYNCLESEYEEIEQRLYNGSPLDKKAWPEAGFAQSAASLAEVLTAAAWPTEKDFAAVEKFASSAIKAKTKVKHRQNPPAHQIFDLCEQLLVAYQLYRERAARLVSLVKREFLDFAAGPDGIEAGKRKARQQGYSDFLLGLRRVLAGRAGGALRTLAGERFKVALVDEFQDTDPVQYGIFKALFDRPELLFYRIGDPKQSIYGFRGADIYAYLDAAQETEQIKATLDLNFRSTPELLRAINRIFAVSSPFLLAGIDYREMRCGRQPQLRLMLDGRPDVPFRFWHLAGEEGGNLTAPQARCQLVDAVVSRCLELLFLAREPLPADSQPRCWRAELVDGENSFRRPLQASDIAVLTTTNKEATQVWAACSARGVPAVITAAGNLWQTAEARELFFFLNAVLFPDDDHSLSTALATVLMGCEADWLGAVHDSSEIEAQASGKTPCLLYEAWRSSFTQARETWRKRGLMAMFAEFPKGFGQLPAVDFDLRLNLSRAAQGERALTNFFHLQEILHQVEGEHLFGPQALLLWLHEHLTDVARDENEYELRLESEAEALKIMTVHKSKGLEFPIVFAPFLWSRGFKPAEHKRSLTVFHQAAPGGDGYLRCLDLNADVPKAHLQAAAAEELAENLRLFYVALTRAQTSLYLAWPQLRDSGKTALMYLRRPPRSPADLQDFIGKGGPPPSLARIDDAGAEIWEEVSEIVRETPASSRQSQTAASGAPPLLAARCFRRQLRSPGGLLSFSRLTAEAHAETNKGLTQSEPAVLRLKEGASPPLADFPAGAATGNVIHAILEKLDFAIVRQPHWRDDLALHELLCSSLERYGLIDAPESAVRSADARLLSVYRDKLLQLIDNVLNTPLSGVDGCFKLAQEGLARRSEMEFFLPLAQSPDGKKVTELFKGYGMPAYALAGADKIAAWQLAFPADLPTRGYLNGFIDLVFKVDNRYYLLDWKTNNLGPAYENYQAEALQRHMLDSDYILQYHLYLIALHQFLQNRLADYDYETDFGGVYYLYLRGVNGINAESGVFYDRPSLALVERLAEMFRGSLTL